MTETWNILVAQKNINLVKKFQKFFEDNPCRYNSKIVKVYCATTSNAAQKILLEKHIHLSFVGVSLEQVDSGLAVINFIRTQLNNHETRVIMIVDHGDNFAPSWASDFYKINGIKTSDQLLQDNIIKIETVMQIHDYANAQKCKQRLIVAETNTEAMAQQGMADRKVKNFLATVLTEYTPVPVILAGRDGVIVRFNKAAEAFFSVPARSVIGLQFSKAAVDLGIGQDLKEILKNVLVEGCYRQNFTRVVRGELMTMSFSFLAVSGTAKNKDVEGFSIVGDQAILSSEVVSTGVAPELPVEGCVPEIHTVEQNMLHVSEQVKKLGETSITALLVGETGVGKEFFARIIHKYSPRKNKIFVAVNCRILEDRLEDEMFGSRAFPKSILERCDGGTLFLGHVHELSQNMQTRLLGFLLRGGFYHNITGEYIESDVRFIVSMGREAVYNINALGFNEDLYYRISAVPLYLPSVSERKADIPLLMRTFLKLHKCTNLELTDSFMKAIVAYDWPGNIREMVNTAQFIALAKITDRPVDLPDLPTTIRWQATKGVVADEVFDNKSDIPKVDAEVALRQFDGNISRAAGFFGVSRATFYRVLEKDKDLAAEQK